MSSHVHKLWGPVVGVVAMLAVAAPATAVAPGGVGDCDDDGKVETSDLITGVAVALGSLPRTACPELDVNLDGGVSIDELLRAVGAALAVPPRVAFIVATDFQTGSFGTIGLDDLVVAQRAGPARLLNSDAVARTFGGLVYVLNRFGADNIQILDPARAFATVLQCSTGNGSNPNDITIVSPTKAYVTRLAARELLIVNPSARPDCSDFMRGTIDLSSLADADGIPDMGQLRLVGDRLFVALGRLQNFQPAGPGAIAVIDATSDTLVDSITLTGENPFGESKGLVLDNGSLVVAEVGLFGVNDGGLERINLESNRAEGFFITESDLGGDVTDFALVNDQLGYAIVSKADFTSDLVGFDPTTRTIVRRLITGGNLSDIELDAAGRLFVADRAITRPGVRVFRASDGVELTSLPLDVGLPPFDIVFLE